MRLNKIHKAFIAIIHFVLLIAIGTLLVIGTYKGILNPIVALVILAIASGLGLIDLISVFRNNSDE